MIPNHGRRSKKRNFTKNFHSVTQTNIFTKNYHLEKTLSPKMIAMNTPFRQHKSPRINLDTKNCHLDQILSAKMAPRTKFPSAYKVLFSPVYSSVYSYINYGELYIIIEDRVRFCQTQFQLTSSVSTS